MDLKGRCVSFQIRDVHIPDPMALLLNLYGDHLLEGMVMYLSDSGAEMDAFALVKVREMDDLLIVPVSRIVGVLRG